MHSNPTILLRTLVIKSCDFSYNTIKDDGAKEIIDSLFINHTLHSLDISGNHFKGEGLQSLPSLVLTNETLKALDLSNNDIGKNGLQYVEHTLLNNKHITKLNLSNCKFKKEEFHSIIAAFRRQSALRNLEIGYCKESIGIKEITELVNAVHNYKYPFDLNMQGNYIGAVGTKVFAAIFKQDTVIEKLCRLIIRLG